MRQECKHVTVRWWKTNCFLYNLTLWEDICAGSEVWVRVKTFVKSYIIVHSRVSRLFILMTMMWPIVFSCKISPKQTNQCMVPRTKYVWHIVLCSQMYHPQKINACPLRQGTCAHNETSDNETREQDLWTVMCFIK